MSVSVLGIGKNRNECTRISASLVVLAYEVSKYSYSTGKTTCRQGKCTFESPVTDESPHCELSFLKPCVNLVLIYWNNEGNYFFKVLMKY